MGSNLNGAWEGFWGLEMFHSWPSSRLHSCEKFLELYAHAWCTFLYVTTQQDIYLRSSIILHIRDLSWKNKFNSTVRWVYKYVHRVFSTTAQKLDSISVPTKSRSVKYFMVCAHVLSCVRLFETFWTVAHQAPLVHGIFSGKNSGVDRSSQPRDRTGVSCVFCIAG